MVSTTEDVLLDSALHVRPGLKPNRSGLNRGDAAFNLDIPCGFGVGVGWTVQAGEQLRGKFGAGLGFQTQGVGENRLSRFRHALILRLGSPANKRLQPTAAGAIMSRRG
jgi:hypothetical protein